MADSSIVDVWLPNGDVKRIRLGASVGNEKRVEVQIGKLFRSFKPETISVFIDALKKAVYEARKVDNPMWVFSLAGLDGGEIVKEVDKFEFKGENIVGQLKGVTMFNLPVVNLSSAKKVE